MIEPTPLHLAKLCQQTYKLPNTGLTIVGGNAFSVSGNVIAFRGSACERDWLRDFEAEPIYLSGVGMVENGFLDGMEQVLSWIQTHGPDNPVLCGHSKGAANAVILAGMMTASKMAWDSLTTFGCPRPGYAQLRDLLASANRPMTAYRNGADCVPTVPMAFLWWSYRSYTKWTQIGTGDDPVGDHMIAEYVKSLGGP